MKLEWDEAKRQATLRGLDFADVEGFEWDTAIFTEDYRRDYRETRIIAFGFIEAVFVCLVYTVRLGAVRVISLRRANKRKRKAYDRVRATHR